MVKKQRWHVYVLYSPSTGRLYTGISPDPHKRLVKHNAGKGAKYTRAGRPWQIVWTRLCDSKSEALKLEYLIKKMKRQEKLLFTGLAA
jgi:putative endonuclease